MRGVVLALSVLMGGDSTLARYDAQVEAAYPGTPTIAAGDVLRQDATFAPILVDARTAEERAVSILPGAVTPQALLESPPRSGHPVVVYCTIGMRSADLTLRLRAAGWDAYNLRGGVLAWAAAGGEFVTADGRATHRVHVYGARWNHLPGGYEAVW